MDIYPARPRRVAHKTWKAAFGITPSKYETVFMKWCTKPELIAAIRQQNLKSVSAVFQHLAGGKEDAGSKPGLASLLKTLWKSDYEDERDARFINDRVHA